MLAKGYELAKEAAGIARRAHHGRDFYGADHEQADAFKRLFGDRFDPEKSVKAARKAVDAKTWMFLRDLAGLDRLMDAEAKPFRKAHIETLGCTENYFLICLNGKLVSYAVGGERIRLFTKCRLR